MIAPAISEMTLDELRLELAGDIAASAVFDGWTEAAVENAAKARGADPRIARLAFKEGAADMVAAWIASIDAAMEAAVPAGSLAGVSIRERIRRLVQFRLDAISGKEEALKRALAIMAMPQNARASLRRGWQSADLMWRLAGDKSTDYNYYSKRAILSGIYAATLAIFADDHSEDKAETRAFLDRRIGEVMRFEKAKARMLRPAEERFSMVRLLGRLRYPAR
jgi:ubiquinone biosynthesis protein COQ9